jgi:Flp pilus assembly protein CpaB
MILVEAIGDVPFSVGPIAVLAVAVLGLLAVAAAPDVLLRAVGTSAVSRQTYLSGEPALAAKLIKPGPGAMSSSAAVARRAIS